VTRRSSARQRGGNRSRQWRRMDLHLHTPGSSDYQEPGTSYIEILRQAFLRGVDIIAFADHNTVAGFAAMKKEIEQLFWLEDNGRIEPDEKRLLEEYRRLLEKVLVLPGFEFTATFGFHILGIFPSETPVSLLEHLLLTLNVPPEQLAQGSSTVGATSDVLTAYQVINAAGGLVIAAHANSSHGVVMRGLDFGGQTRIAYTQDSNLHALEVTDLEKRGRYTTRKFFDGSKPEYPRAMRCIQGSDAHRLVRDPSNPKNLGVGDRVTEILLTEVSFEALAAVIKGNDLALTRPYRGPAKPVDFVQLAREEGESIVQAFHENTTQRGGYMDRILRDICAMANTNGGTIYIGLSDNIKEAPIGVRDPKKVVERLEAAITNRFSPEPEVQIDHIRSQGKTIVRVTVQPGKEIPYAIDANNFYVRDESETNLAVRDEIVRLVELGRARQDLQAGIDEQGQSQTQPQAPAPVIPQPIPARHHAEPPRTGVEVVKSEQRQGTIYHTVRDLRNGNMIQNVTKSSARKLWHYAISETESGSVDPNKLNWANDMALIKARSKGGQTWYDLALRDGDQVHIYYGVTDSGLNDEWMALLGENA
jgi:hypothetical protein